MTWRPYTTAAQSPSSGEHPTPNVQPDARLARAPVFDFDFDPDPDFDFDFDFEGG